MATIERFEFVEDSADLYRKHADDEIWRRDHEWATLCFDYAELVYEGVNLYDSICRLDNDWRCLVYAGDVEYDVAMENRIVGLFAKWLSISERVLALYDNTRLKSEYHGRHFDGEPIDLLRKHCREIRASMKNDADFFASDRTFELAEKAITMNREGSTEDMECLG